MKKIVISFYLDRPGTDVMVDRPDRAMRRRRFYNDPSPASMARLSKALANLDQSGNPWKRFVAQEADAFIDNGETEAFFEMVFEVPNGKES